MILYKNDKRLVLTWADCVLNVDWLLKFHKNHGELAALIDVRSLVRNGHLEISENGSVEMISGKPQASEG